MLALCMPGFASGLGPGLGPGPRPRPGLGWAVLEYRVPTWIDPPEIHPMTSMDVSPVTDFGGGVIWGFIVARVTQTL